MLPVSTDTLGHVTAASGSLTTRTLTLADLGHTEANGFGTLSIGADTGYTWGQLIQIQAKLQILFLIL